MAKTEVPITPSVLRWAMEDGGFTEDSLASRLDVPIEKVRAWLAGNELPTLTSFRKLAAALRRSQATFLLPDPPVGDTARVAFRHSPEGQREEFIPEERRYLREARWVQRTLTWILREQSAVPIALPSLRVGEDVGRAAKSARDALGMATDAHETWTSEYDAQRAWRGALERTGVFVFLLPMGEDACRGFSLWDDWAPLLAVNTKWNAQARIYSMIHEFAHLLSRSDSACMDRASGVGRKPGDPVERWCESVAARVLIPTEPLKRLLQELGVPQQEDAATLTTAERVARRFRVSLKAATLRLIEVGVANWHLYATLPSGKDAKGGGGGGEGRDRIQIRLDQYGYRTASVFLGALDKDVIDRSDVLDYLRVADAELDRFPTELSEPAQ